MAAAEAEEVPGCGGQSRKEKRKALKKQKRKQIRKELAIREREEEDVRANDPEEQLRARLREQEEAEAAERSRRAFEEGERLWLEAAARIAESEAEERRERLLEESQKEKVDPTGELEEGDDDWEYVEEGPVEIIWKGNEIIVKKKKVKVPKRRSTDKQPTKEDDDDRPTSNPLPPQSVAFASFNSTPPVSAQVMLEGVAQQIPNFGTEQDKAHCPFHLKTGACRFGSRCSRVHFHPDKSCTMLIKNMYNGPGLAWEQDEGLEYTDEDVEHSYEEFYEDVHTEFLKFGEIVNFKVCRNGSFHLRGNVYVHYKFLESAILAYNTMNGRYFAGKQITCEFVNITRWKIAICGEYMKSRLKTCSRGTACNFIHCFHNPGGDYEWADWDNPPPKHWVKKMAALFGPSDELEHDKHVELDDLGLSRDSSKKRMLTSRRYHSRRSRHSKLDFYNSGSGGDVLNENKDRHSSRLRRRWYSSERRMETVFSDKQERYERRVHHHTEYSAHGYDSHKGNFDEKERCFPDENQNHKEKDNFGDLEGHDRKHRKAHSSSRSRGTVLSDQLGKSEKKSKYYRQVHSDRHRSLDWDSGRDSGGDNRDERDSHSSEKSPHKCASDVNEQYIGSHKYDLGSRSEFSHKSTSWHTNDENNQFKKHQPRYQSHDHEQESESKSRKHEANEEGFSSGESSDDQEKRGTESCMEDTGGHLICKGSSRSCRHTEPEESEKSSGISGGTRHGQDKKHSSRDKNGRHHQKRRDYEVLEKENSNIGSDNLEPECRTCKKRQRSQTPVQHSRSSTRERSHRSTHGS